ncbi:16174_t:CDS:2, partial [Racocetra persica]
FAKTDNEKQNVHRFINYQPYFAEKKPKSPVSQENASKRNLEF